MKALILAAGIGSRLKPITDTTPKALVPVGGVPMLERTAVRLKAVGVNALVVNAHHHARKVTDFCAALSKRLVIPIAVSREDDLLLDTGGAIKRASALLKGRAPFFVHNVDVLTDLDLKALAKAHANSGALATVSVRERESGRAYLFDEKGRLVGHDRGEGGVTWAKGPVPNPRRLPFDGIHVISTELLDKIMETGVFSITKTYLRLAASGSDIHGFRGDAWEWHDIGNAQKLAAAEAWASK
jgi:NDP-sugar pyrophosphorylase family protein